MRPAQTLRRCPWAGDDPLYVDYHDREWGVPQHDDRRLFEMLLLEGAQAGLSWITILRKRDGYRAAYDGFDPARIARWDRRKMERLRQDPGIVRNRLKIESARKNARAFLALQAEHGSFDRWLWGFVDGTPRVGRYRRIADVPASTPLSDTVSKALKGRGMSFVGSTIVQAYLQAVGVVNDHLVGCFRHGELTGGAARRRRRG